MPGETGETYTVTLADLAHTLRVVVSASGPEGTSQAMSAATTTVGESAPANDGSVDLRSA